MIRAIALLSMVIDHIGLIFFEDIELFRIIGRVAFPVYLYMCVEGYKNTHSKRRYALRMLLFFVISAYPCYLSFGNAINIGITYLCVLGECYATDLIIADAKTKKLRGCLLLIGIYSLCIILGADFPYSWYGLLMGICLYLRDDTRLIISQIGMILTTFLYIYIRPDMAIQLIALPVFLLLTYVKKEWIYGRVRCRYFFYVFYPGHILVLYWLRLMYLSK